MQHVIALVQEAKAAAHERSMHSAVQRAHKEAAARVAAVKAQLHEVLCIWSPLFQLHLVDAQHHKQVTHAAATSEAARVSLKEQVSDMQAGQLALQEALHGVLVGLHTWV